MADETLPRQNGAVPSVTCEGCGGELVVVTEYGSWFTSTHEHEAPAPTPKDPKVPTDPTEVTS